MTKMILSKKAVSPLIATVLLIAFSVALGAVVMNWGRGFVQSQTDSVDKNTKVTNDCSVNIILDFVKINSATQVCQYAPSAGGNNTLRIVVQNLGSTPATGISVRVIDNNSNVYTFQNTSTTLGAGSAQRYDFNTGALNTSMRITYVSASPMIQTPGSSTNQICASNKIETSLVNNCYS